MLETPEEKSRKQKPVTVRTDYYEAKKHKEIRELIMILKASGKRNTFMRFERVELIENSEKYKRENL